MITVGYGDIVPQNNAERLFCVFFMLGSNILLSYSVNTIGMIIQEIKTETEENSKKIGLINDYMANKHISPPLQMREYLNYYWKEQDQEAQLIQQQEIANQLPESLKMALLKEVNEAITQNCPLISQYPFTVKFQREMYKIIQQINLPPMSLLETEKNIQGIEGPCIFYVEKGGVDQIANFGNSNVKVYEYQEQQYFGFEEFITGQSQNRVTYKSNKFTRLQVIPRNKFIELLKDHSDDNEVFNQLKDDYRFQQLEIGDQFNILCNACKKKDHSLNNCPLVHFIADREKIMKSHLYLNIALRRQLKRARSKNVFQSLTDKQFLEDCAEAYISENKKFLKDFYEDPSDNESNISDQSNSNGSEIESQNEVELDENSLSKLQRQEQSIALNPQIILNPRISILSQGKRSSKLASIEEIPESNQDGSTTENNIIQIEEELDSQSSRGQKIEKGMSVMRNSVANARKFSSRLNVFNLTTKKKSIFLKEKLPKKPQMNARSSIFQNLVERTLLMMNNEKEKKSSLSFLNPQSQSQTQQKIKKEKKFINDERLMLSILEKNKYVYQEKMDKFLTQIDLHLLDILLIRLRVQYQQNQGDPFEVGKSFQFYKINGNPSVVISQLKVLQNSFQQLNQIQRDLLQGDEVNKNMQLSSYLFFPFQYIMKYRMQGRKQSSSMEATPTDLQKPANSNRGAKVPKAAKKKSKKQVFPLLKKFLVGNQFDEEQKESGDEEQKEVKEQNEENEENGERV